MDEINVFRVLHSVLGFGQSGEEGRVVGGGRGQE